MDPISILTLAAGLVPSVMDFFGAGKNEKSLAGKTVNIIKNLTGEDSLPAGMNAINQNKEMISAFKKQMDEAVREEWKARADTAEQVNQTMRAELVSGKWYQRMWRPFYAAVATLAIGSVWPAIAYWSFANPPVAGKLMTAFFEGSIVIGLLLTPLGVIGIGRSKEKIAIHGKNQRESKLKKILTTVFKE